MEHEIKFKLDPDKQKSQLTVLHQRIHNFIQSHSLDEIRALRTEFLRSKSEIIKIYKTSLEKLNSESDHQFKAKMIDHYEYVMINYKPYEKKMLEWFQNLIDFKRFSSN